MIRRDRDESHGRRRERLLGTWLVIGIGVGTAVGVALGNIAVGVAMGVGIGLSLGVALGRKRPDAPD